MHTDCHLFQLQIYFSHFSSKVEIRISIGCPSPVRTNIYAALFFSHTGHLCCTQPGLTGLVYRQLHIKQHNFRKELPKTKQINMYIRGPFEKFVDSPYYSESELRGHAVTISFSKYLLWQAMYFLQRSTHFSKTCCRPVIT
jgi:hypothetical protein